MLLVYYMKTQCVAGFLVGVLLGMGAPITRCDTGALSILVAES